MNGLGRFRVRCEKGQSSISAAGRRDLFEPTGYRLHMRAQRGLSPLIIQLQFSSVVRLWCSVRYRLCHPLPSGITSICSFWIFFKALFFENLGDSFLMLPLWLQCVLFTLERFTLLYVLDTDDSDANCYLMWCLQAALKFRNQIDSCPRGGSQPSSYKFLKNKLNHSSLIRTSLNGGKQTVRDVFY